MPTKQEKIDSLKARIENFKQSLQNPNSMDNAILNSSSPKKDRIRAWGETLEKIMYLEGRYDEIDSISTQITLELRELGLTKNIPYVRMVLPNKYKDDSQRRSNQLLEETYDYSDNNYRKKPDKTEEDYTKENQIEIDHIEEDIKVLQEYLEKLKHNSLMSRLDLKQYDELSTRRTEIRNLLREAMDGRDKVLPSKLHLLIYGFTQGTKSHAFTKYLQYMSKVTELTSKQTVKLLSGRVNKVELLFEPKSKLEARHAGFFGKPCGECGSYRVDVKYNPDQTKDMLFCYRCRTWNERKTEDLVEKLV